MRFAAAQFPVAARIPSDANLDPDNDTLLGLHHFDRVAGAINRMSELSRFRFGITVRFHWNRSYREILRKLRHFAAQGHNFLEKRCKSKFQAIYLRKANNRNRQTGFIEPSTGGTATNGV